MMEQRKEILDWYKNLDFVKKRIEWFNELENRADFCDKEGGIYAFWEDHHMRHFKVIADPGYYDMMTIFPADKKAKFDETPYFNKTVTSEEVSFLVDSLNMLTDVFLSLVPHYGTKIN